MARILIVDDQADLREALVAVVEADGHEIIEASDGAEAVAKVGAERPDMVLMDGNMSGVDGFEALRRLKSDPATRHVPVVMVTVLDDPAARSRALGLGADAYITKPWGDGELEWRIQQVLTSSASGGSRRYTGAPLR
jgi:two-component system cell cycle response regulator